MRPPTLATPGWANAKGVSSAPRTVPIADAESPNTVARRRKSPRSISPASSSSISVFSTTPACSRLYSSRRLQLSRPMRPSLSAASFWIRFVQDWIQKIVTFPRAIVKLGSGGCGQAVGARSRRVVRVTLRVRLAVRTSRRQAHPRVERDPAFHDELARGCRPRPPRGFADAARCSPAAVEHSHEVRTRSDSAGTSYGDLQSRGVDGRSLLPPARHHERVCWHETSLHRLLLDVFCSPSRAAEPIAGKAPQHRGVA